MALILEAPLETGIYEPIGQVAKACLPIRKIALSDAYELPDGTTIIGEIMESKNRKGEKNF